MDTGEEAAVAVKIEEEKETAARSKEKSTEVAKKRENKKSNVFAVSLLW